MKQVSIAYIRVSTDRQTEGNGPDQQRRSICTYAAMRGLAIDEWVFEDESGTVEDREQILQLKMRAQNGEITGIIIDRMDRLGRRLQVCENLYQFFRASGAEVICVAQQLDDSPAGTMLRQMLGAVAEFQRSEMLSRLALCKRAARARKGTYGGGPVPYGYKSVGEGKLIADPKYVGLVQRIFELRELSYKEICASINQEGYRTRVGTSFSPMQVLRIIKRELVYGAVAGIGNTNLDSGVEPQQPNILGNKTQHRRSA